MTTPERLRLLMEKYSVIPALEPTCQVASDMLFDTNAQIWGILGYANRPRKEYLPMVAAVFETALEQIKLGIEDERVKGGEQ